MRSAQRLSAVAVIAVCAIGAVWLLLPGEADRLRKQKEELLQERVQLQRAIERLTGEDRVAEVHVLDQVWRTGRNAQTRGHADPDPDADRDRDLNADRDRDLDADRDRDLDADRDRDLDADRDRGNSLPHSPRVTTTIEFIELDRQQHPLPARRFELEDEVIFFDALVVKFDHQHVAAGDALRGKSLALFRRIYGEHQNPVDGFAVDPGGEVPNIFRVASQPSALERRLWTRFWDYAADPDLAAREGVRVAQGEAVYVPMRKGQVWTLTLQNDGGLNIRLHRTAAAAPADIHAGG